MDGKMDGDQIPQVLMVENGSYVFLDMFSCRSSPRSSSLPL